ncbi:hypothetical protein PENSPDRAFT_336351 [Peniophora sp. CONT]|nr:hypothetical protein PENSPDRAFT_336351 [Peniophora sp. CONT]
MADSNRSTRPYTGQSSSKRPFTGGSRPWTGRSSTRPYTSGSRPATGRPTTATSTRHESSYVIAVLEGRGVAREVGIACLEKDTGRVALVQVNCTASKYEAFSLTRFCAYI